MEDNQSIQLFAFKDKELLKSEDAEYSKREAIEQAATITQVNTPEENAIAVASQLELSNLLKQAEMSRIQLKDPYLKICQMIDKGHKLWVADLMTANTNVSMMIGNYQTLELQKKRAAEAAENERLLAIEREKAAEIAKAPSHQAVEAIQEKYDARAKQEPVAVNEVPKATGQVLKEAWNIVVVDIHKLYKSHSQCVKLEVIRSEVIALLNDGVTVQGVTANKIVDAGVRQPKAPILAKHIDI